MPIVNEEAKESNNEELKIIQDNSAKAANDSNNEALEKAEAIVDDKKEPQRPETNAENGKYLEIGIIL